MRWVLEETDHADELYIREDGPHADPLRNRAVAAVLSPHRSGIQTEEHREIMRLTAKEIIDAHNRM